MVVTVRRYARRERQARGRAQRRGSWFRSWSWGRSRVDRLLPLHVTIAVLILVVVLGRGLRGRPVLLQRML
jgi:hypothetical protein